MSQFSALLLYIILFFSYIAPLCIPFAVAAMALHYWIDKYNLLKCSSSTVALSFPVARTVLKMFELGVVVFAGGNLYFNYLLRG